MFPGGLPLGILLSTVAEASEVEAQVQELFPANPAAAYVVEQYLSGKRIKAGPLKQLTNGEKLTTDKGVRFGTGPWFAGGHQSSQPFPRAGFELGLDDEDQSYRYLEFSLTDPQGCVSAFGTSNLSGIERIAESPSFEIFTHGLNTHVLYKPERIVLDLTRNLDGTCITSLTLEGGRRPADPGIEAPSLDHMKASLENTFAALWPSSKDIPPYTGEPVQLEEFGRVQVPSKGIVLAESGDRKKALLSFGSVFYLGEVQDGLPHGDGLLAEGPRPDIFEPFTLESTLEKEMVMRLHGAFVQGRPEGVHQVRKGRYGHGELHYRDGEAVAVQGRLLRQSAGEKGYSDFFYEGDLVDGEPRDDDATVRFHSGSLVLGYRGAGVDYEGDPKVVVEQPLRMYDREERLVYEGTIDFEDKAPIAQGFGVYHHFGKGPEYTLEGHFTENELDTNYTARLFANGRIYVGHLYGVELGRPLPEDPSLWSVHVYQPDQPGRRAGTGEMAEGWIPDKIWLIDERTIEGKWERVGQTEYRGGYHCSGSGENFFGITSTDCGPIKAAMQRREDAQNRARMVERAQEEAKRDAERQAMWARFSDNSSRDAGNAVFARPSSESPPEGPRPGLLQSMVDEISTYRTLILHNQGVSTCSVRVLPLQGRVAFGSASHRIEADGREKVVLTPSVRDVRLDTSCTSITTSWEPR